MPGSDSLAPRAGPEPYVEQRPDRTGGGAHRPTILGANGIMGEYPIMRHANNLESVYTCEGTDDMHTLIVGEQVTGISAVR